MSKQVAHDTYKALKIKVPQRCAQLGISRDRVLLRFDRWAEGATRTVLTNQFGDTKEIPATDLQMKANIELGKLTGCYEQIGEVGERQDSGGGITINLVIADEGRAREINAKLSARRGTSRQLDMGEEVDEDKG